MVSEIDTIFEKLNAETEITNDPVKRALIKEFILKRNYYKELLKQRQTISDLELLQTIDDEIEPRIKEILNGKTEEDCVILESSIQDDFPSLLKEWKEQNKESSKNYRNRVIIATKKVRCIQPRNTIDVLQSGSNQRLTVISVLPKGVAEGNFSDSLNIKHYFSESEIRKLEKINQEIITFATSLGFTDSELKKISERELRETEEDAKNLDKSFIFNIMSRSSRSDDLTMEQNSSDDLFKDGNQYQAKPAKRRR